MSIWMNYKGITTSLLNARNPKTSRGIVIWLSEFIKFLKLTLFGFSVCWKCTEERRGTKRRDSSSGGQETWYLFQFIVFVYFLSGQLQLVIWLSVLLPWVHLLNLISFFYNLWKPTGPEEGAKICYKCKKVGHLSRDCQEHQVDTSDRHANGGVDEESNALDKATSELDKVTIEEDDIHEIGEEEKEKLNDVDYLTGNPLPSDILLYAVPVCGPYNAVQSYKYRVKIIPGSVKRGKGNKWSSLVIFPHTFIPCSL